MPRRKLLLTLAMIALIAAPAFSGEREDLMYHALVPWPFKDMTPVDTDGDGVPDGSDRCANTVMGAIVDENGCALDADGDGVPDGIDTCAMTPRGAVVDAKGCPVDSDGDGVFDGLDRCDNTPRGAKVDNRGCPIDSDKDGIPDGLDRCDGTPKGARVDRNGCPSDSDGDGVFDGLDLCANTPAGVKVDAKGCPMEITKTETEFLDSGMIRSSTVRFETSKADLTADSFAELNEIGNILVQWPDLKIEIGGHSDSSGNDVKNQQLSEARARAVLGYLLKKFPQISAAQYTIVGYGEANPVADNATAAGRAENRRVEFKVLNVDQLKRQVEKRRGK